MKKDDYLKNCSLADLDKINRMDVGDSEAFDEFCKYANEHIDEFLPVE